MGVLSDHIKRKWNVAETSDKNQEEIRQEVKKYSEQLKQIEKVKNSTVQIDPGSLRQIMIRHASHLIPGDKTFIVDNENDYFLKTIAYYFSNDERFLKSKIITNTPDLKKGLLITGKCGFGKTLTFRAVQKCFTGFTEQQVAKKFKTKSCNELVNGFNIEGSEFLTRFMKQDNWMFDDFGTENKGKHYGLEENVMGLILEARYELYTREGKQTHLTSNLSPAEIRSSYGFRIDSRLDEMFNIIMVSGKDRRK